MISTRDATLFEREQTPTRSRDETENLETSRFRRLQSRPSPPTPQHPHFLTDFTYETHSDVGGPKSGLKGASL